MALHVNSEHERRDIPRADTFDFHESPDNAVAVLLSVDGDTLRCFEAIWEMAAGRGALVKPLRRAGYRVIASDIIERGCPRAGKHDFLSGRSYRAANLDPAVLAGITNPPFNRAKEFILEACERCDYVAMLLRFRFAAANHFIKTDRHPTRLPLWVQTRIPLARIIIPHGRLKMMHRDGYRGKKTDSSMIDFAWFVWERTHQGEAKIMRAPKLLAA
jgi:hypothetical protein